MSNITNSLQVKVNSFDKFHSCLDIVNKALWWGSKLKKRGGVVFFSFSGVRLGPDPTKRQKHKKCPPQADTFSHSHLLFMLFKTLCSNGLMVKAVRGGSGSHLTPAASQHQTVSARILLPRISRYTFHIINTPIPIITMLSVYVTCTGLSSFTKIPKYPQRKTNG